MSSSVLA